ncbi:BH3-only protein sayonara isoform X1 [Brevipalpus obovatus]|uniref:BH3-only protein sayonara isoform X1 n=1 Tax=Brevipalpus obovatus TaxID=246614 RepID=UPI003D9E55B9
MGCGSSVAQQRNGLTGSEMEDMSSFSSKSGIIQINKESLRDYLYLEHAIRRQERKHILETYRIKTEQLDQLEQNVLQAEEILEKCQQEAKHLQEKVRSGDFHSVREFILRKSYRNDELTKDEEAFLDALNHKEIVEREYQNTLQEIKVLNLDIKKLSKEAEKLQELYTSRDKLLDTIFEGQYGSDLENQLERELDWLLEQKHHVDQAYFRWKQAQILAKEACRDLNEGIQKWANLRSLTTEGNESRYERVAEIRNKLSEGSQNLRSAQRYLPNITFPYCTPDEVETLEKAISYIFTDMQIKDRHEHALACYQITFKRASALKQWLDHVLNSTISRDLFEITEDCKARATELRNERTRLIRMRIEELTGIDFESDALLPHEFRDSGVDSEFDDTSTADEQIAHLFENSRNDDKGASSLTPDPTRMSLVMPTPLTSASLAPAPRKEEIFGRIESIRNKHEREIMDLQRNKKINQVRVAQGLKEKLQSRRSRRSRMRMHERELGALQESVPQYLE